MPKIAAVGLLAATIVGVVGCADPSALIEADPSPTPAATSTQAVAGTEAVAAPFDPCIDIDDDTLRRAGLNPAARERVVPPSPDITAACQFTSGTMDVTIATSTETFEAFRDANLGRRIGLDIGSRPTVIARPDDPNAPCELAMKTPDGIVLVVAEISVAAREWGMDRCGGISELATVLEPTIGPL